MFDENGDRVGLTQIEQLQFKTEVRVGVYDPFSEYLDKINWENDTPIIWSGEQSSNGVFVVYVYMCNYLSIYI